VADEGLVSTIIPVYNRPALLREAVASVIAQTYRPIEILIIDDGSTDGTAAAAEDLARIHGPLVRVLRVAHGGPGRAREAARQLARGEFLQHLDSDDLLLPRKFELQVAALRAQPECGAAYGWTRLCYPDGTCEEKPWKRSGEQIETMFPSMLTLRWWDTPTPLYHRSVIDAAGPWSPLSVEEDWEYDCRIAAQGVRLAYVAEWVCVVREHREARASGHATPAVLHDRAAAHLLMLDSARRAQLDPASAEMQFFARELFHLGRQCGAAGLGDESRDLVAAAATISGARDVRVYQRIAAIIGWRNAGRLAGLRG
jgi:glycosyltransferase involved in cell wall biosynthesis